VGGGGRGCESGCEAGVEVAADYHCGGKVICGGVVETTAAAEAAAEAAAAAAAAANNDHMCGSSLNPNWAPPTTRRTQVDIVWEPVYCRVGRFSGRAGGNC